MDARPKASSEARVATAVAGRHLTQLCKHFQHKLPVTLSDDHGTIAFPGGTCALQANDGFLHMQVTADEEAALTTLEDVVARHLVRFAFRDPPEIRWTRVC